MSLKKRGLNAAVIEVSVTSALAQLVIGIVVIPLTIDHSPSSQWYGVFILLTGAVLTMPITWIWNRVVSLASAEYVELSKVLANTQQGWVSVQHILSLKPEHHVRTDLGTTLMLDTGRNALFMALQYGTIILIEFVIYLLFVAK